MTTYHCFYQCFNIQFDNHFDFLRSFKQTTGTITIGCEGQWNMPWWVQTLQQMKCYSKNRKQILARKHEAILLPKNRQHRGLSTLRNSNTIYVIIYSMWLIFLPLVNKMWGVRNAKNDFGQQPKHGETNIKSSQTPLSVSHKWRIC